MPIAADVPQIAGRCNSETSGRTQSVADRLERRACPRGSAVRTVTDPAQPAKDQSIAYERAALARRDGRRADAIAAYRRILTGNADAFEAHRALGQILRDEGRHEEALVHFRCTAAINPHDVWALSDVAAALKELGEFDQAEANLRQALTLNPRFFNAHRGLGQIARMRGDHCEALAHFQAAAEIAPEREGILRDVAAELRDQGLCDQAIAAYRASLAIDDNSPLVHRAIGQMLRQKGEHAEALKHFEATLAINPGDPWTLNDVATARLELGRFDDARSAFEGVLVRDPRFLHGHLGLARLAATCGDHAAALEHFKSASAMAPNNMHIALGVATQLRALGRRREAAVGYSQIAATYKSDFQAHRALGQMAREEGDHVTALEHFRATLSCIPDDVWALNDFASELHELGRREEAAAAYRAILARDASFFPAHIGLGRLARMSGDHGAALGHFQSAAKLTPDDAWIAQDVATELRDLDRFDDAKRILSDLIARMPGLAQARISYAWLVRSRTPSDQLIEMYEQAIAADADYVPARLALAEEYLRVWRLDEAEAIYDSILRTKTKHGPALMGKGHVARRRGLAASALKWFEAAAEDAVHFGAAAIELSREYLDAGRVADANRINSASLARNPLHLPTLLHQAALARAAGDFSSARSRYAAILTAHPDNLVAAVELAVEETRAGVVESSLLRLRAVLRQDPRFVLAIEALADLALQLDDLAGAALLLERAVEIDPGRLWANLNLALCRAKLARPPPPFDEFEFLKVKFGALPEIYIAEAALHKALGDLALARARLAEATVLFPSSFDVWFQRTLAHIVFGDFDQAAEALQIRTSPNAREQARAAFLQAQFEISQWRLETGYAKLLESLQFNPNECWINEGVARISLMRLDLDAAERHLSLALQNDPSHRLKQAGRWRISQSHTGQLYDEYRLDGEALKRLQRAESDPDPIAALIALERELPTYTPVAISLLIKFRQMGRFAPLHQAMGASGDSIIPRKIAQFWDQDAPADVDALCRTWQDHNPDYAYCRFDNSSARAFLCEYLPEKVCAAFDRAREPAQRADIFRLAWLHLEGGYYVDADDRCLAPIEAIRAPGKTLVVYQEEYGTVGNNFIGAIAGHPAIERALFAAVKSVERGDSEMVWLSTGPGLLTRELAFFLAADAAANLSGLMVLERHEMQRVSAMHCLTHYKHTERHWSRKAFKSGGPRKGQMAVRQTFDWREILDGSAVPQHASAVATVPR